MCINTMKRLATWCIVLVGLLLVAAFLDRATTFGLNNVFSREHMFIEERPLTDSIAISLTSQTLELDGRDVSQMCPYGGFSRGDASRDGGYVLWGPLPDGSPWTYLVSVEKTGKHIRCRAIRGK
jgi:hypothetical protein